MKTPLFCILLFAASAFAEVDKAQLELFKKESASLRSAIDGVMSSIVPGRVGPDAVKATYLEGYGAVFTLEVSLEPTRSPFSTVKTPAEVQATVNERRKEIEAKLTKLLKDRAGNFQSVGSAESVTVVVYLFNSNPVDVPDLPSQLVFTVKKQDSTQVVLRAY